MKISDVEDARILEIEQSEVVSGSVFVTGFGFCIEVDRLTFVTSVCDEFNLLPAACRELRAVA